MALPGVNINLMNGQLGIIGPSENGITALVIACAAAPTAGYGTAFTVKTKADVKAAFADANNAAVVTALNDYFYGEAPEGTEVHITCMAQTTALNTLAVDTNAEKSLNKAAGKARLLGVLKFPAGNYSPTVTNGFDADVHTAVTALQTLANTWLGKKKPFRFFVQGYACDGVPGNAKDYGDNTTTSRNGSITVGEFAGNTAYFMLSVMGRAARVEPQENVGKLRTGSLKIPSAAVYGIAGSTTITDATLDGYNTKRYITAGPNLTASGYVVTDDHTLIAATDDYNNLRYGRVIDNAVRIAFTTYYQELKNDVDVDDNGRISKVAEKALENAIEAAVDQNMAAQLSKKNDGGAYVTCAVNPDYNANIALYNQNGITSAPNFNLLQTGKVYLFIKLRPKGCVKDLNIFIGFTATT